MPRCNQIRLRSLTNQIVFIRARSMHTACVIVPGMRGGNQHITYYDHHHQHGARQLRPPPPWSMSVCAPRHIAIVPTWHRWTQHCSTVPGTPKCSCPRLAQSCAEMMMRVSRLVKTATTDISEGCGNILEDIENIHNTLTRLFPTNTNTATMSTIRQSGREHTARCNHGNNCNLINTDLSRQFHNVQ